MQVAAGEHRGCTGKSWQLVKAEISSAPEALHEPSAETIHRNNETAFIKTEVLSQENKLSL